MVVVVVVGGSVVVVEVVVVVGGRVVVVEVVVVGRFVVVAEVVVVVAGCVVVDAVWVELTCAVVVVIDASGSSAGSEVGGDESTEPAPSKVMLTGGSAADRMGSCADKTSPGPSSKAQVSPPIRLPKRNRTTTARNANELIWSGFKVWPVRTVSHTR